MNEDRRIERRWEKYALYKYVLLGIVSNKPYWVAEVVLERLIGHILPIPQCLTDKVVTTAQAGAKYEQYVIIATRVDRGDAYSWLFHATVVTDPSVEWEA